VGNSSQCLYTSTLLREATACAISVLPSASQPLGVEEAKNVRSTSEVELNRTECPPICSDLDSGQVLTHRRGVSEGGRRQVVRPWKQPHQ
jgi:hypothetical protein